MAHPGLLSKQSLSASEGLGRWQMAGSSGARAISGQPPPAHGPAPASQEGHALVRIHDRCPTPASQERGACGKATPITAETSLPALPAAEASLPAPLTAEIAQPAADPSLCQSVCLDSIQSPLPLPLPPLLHSPSSLSQPESLTLQMFY